MFRTCTPTLAILCAAALYGAAPPAEAGTYKVVYSFLGGSDGAHPVASLLDVGGTLYGTTQAGGSSNAGTVFAVNPATGVETQLHAFTGSAADGEYPDASLIDAGGILYGTTFNGGAAGLGTVFSLDPATGVETVLYSFTAKHGAEPLGGLTLVGPKLYGTAYAYGLGGGTGSGMVFSMNPATGATAVAHAFDGPDGATPEGTLLQLGADLYGTTVRGGANGYGTVFSLDAATHAESVVYSFAGAADGQYPADGVIKVNGVLYGTTLNGGTTGCKGTGCGTVFSLNPTTGTETIVYAFRGGIDGASPSTSLLNVGGKLYGVTSQGGSASNCMQMGCGIVFEVNPATGVEKIVHSYGTGAKGAAPYGGLIDVGGTLYGTTAKGGTGGHGTIFSYTP